jgi:hypothetical protein
MTLRAGFIPPRVTPALGCFGLLMFGAALLGFAGPAPQLIFASDVVFYLDACHRAAGGQWLGRDFTSPIGPAALLPTVLAMRFFGPDVSGLVGGSVIAWGGFGALAWMIARSRLNSIYAIGFSLFVAGTAAGLYPLDFGDWRSLSYGLLYNRLAWAALALALVAALLPPRTTSGSTTTWLAAGLGAASVWIWALKPNYLLILLPPIIFAFIQAPRLRAWSFGLLGGSAGTLALIAACVSFSPFGYVQTHLGMASEAPADMLLYTWNRTWTENGWLLLGLACICFAALRSAAAGVPRIALGTTVVAIAAATLLANLANCQFSEIPIWGAIAWIAAGVAVESTGVARMARITAIVFALAFTWQPLASMAYNFAWKTIQPPGSSPAVNIASAAWHGLPLRAFPGTVADPAGDLTSAANYALWLNDGLTLLSKHHRGGPVACLDWNNPFPFATGSIPPPGDVIAWHVGRNVGRNYHADPARILNGTEIVMEPVRSLQPASLEFKRSLFAPGLASAFSLVAESSRWRVWKRRAQPLN